MVRVALCGIVLGLLSPQAVAPAESPYHPVLTHYGSIPYPQSAPLRPASEPDYSRFNTYGPGRTFADI